MAGSALQFALQKLDSLLVNEQQLLRGVDTGVKDIRDELECIKSFLREADAREDRDGMRTWVNQVREIAYDIEDVLDEFVLHFNRPHGHGFSGFLHRGIHYIKHLGTHHRIASAIQEIKKQVHNISQRKDMYTIKFIDNGTSNATTDRLHDRHMAALFIEEAELVGIEKPKEELIGWLVKGESQLKVISVVGMGGLGKTTLVRKVYDHERVKGWFSCHAWITVTQLFTIDELLRSILNQFYRERNEIFPGRIDAMEGIQLIETLRHFLRDRRYVVVLDDLWHIQEWDYLKYALPVNNCGSRVLVTTRIRDVGLSCLETCGHVCNLQPLPPAKAWSLFCKKAFRSIPGGTCPPELEDISHDIVSICDGLPLAIVAIAGLLSKKESSVLEWRTLLDNLHAELANNPKLEPIKRILLLSYNDLPHFLKSCFLYFSIFPKDYPVKRITLIRLWIAEGFIESEKGETMEQVAVDYLNDLIDRNMVQVAEHYDYGRVRSCRVHDLIYETILLKSKEENFSMSLVRKKTHMHGRIRRLSIHNAGEDVLQNTSLSHLRALFMFGVNALSASSMGNLFYSFRLLKVLDLEGAPIERFPIEFGKLLHLRYLSLRNTRINKLSKSLGKLENLETLDLKGTYVSELPTKILKLQSLRHLLAYHYYTGRHPPFYHTNGVKVPQGIGRLRDLQKLTYIEANQDSGIVRELGYLTQLRRLGIVKLRKEDGVNLCASIERMNNLRSISVTSIGMDEVLDLQYLKSPPSDLQRLYLRGPLETLPNWISTLQNLVRMRLRWSKLKEDSLRVLQVLPNLVELTLIRAYDGVQLYYQKGGFQKLKILDLEQLDNLNYVMLDGAMPNLQKMYIRQCVQLKAVPLGIEQLVNLKELHLFDMPEVFVQNLRRHEGADRPKVNHIPIVRSYDHEDRVYEEL
ncbi:disease resistance protein RPM1-like [Phoenix dactylifera]|uniref:Disease resistance protein RPM1-like n=1 Tax=Phoenix dactylifera TaxID=42345 RepID=A0A8B8JC04_PHODC|nr:disease resistance protein RPM1-like [Phoenix dactylifera]